MADTQKLVRNKVTGCIFPWTEVLDQRVRVDGDFEYVNEDTSNAAKAPEPAVPEDPRAAEPAHPGADSAGSAGSGEPEVAPAAPGALKDLHWTAIKKMVEAKGGTYTNKAAAIAFLS